MEDRARAQAEKLLDRGLHPVRIAEGFEKACDIAVKQLEKISDKVEFDKSNLEVGWCAARSVLEPVFA